MTRLLVPVLAVFGMVAALALWLLPVQSRTEPVPGMPVPTPLAAVEGGEWVERLSRRISVMEADQRVERIAARSPLSDYTLIGTIEGDEGGWALLGRDGSVQTIAVGAELGGFVLVELTVERAVFERDDERVVLDRRL
jgi:hypothetical protein